MGQTDCGHPRWYLGDLEGGGYPIVVHCTTTVMVSVYMVPHRGRNTMPTTKLSTVASNLDICELGGERVIDFDLAANTD